MDLLKTAQAWIGSNPVQFKAYIATLIGTLGLTDQVADNWVILIMTLLTILTGGFATKRVKTEKKTGERPVGWSK